MSDFLLLPFKVLTKKFEFFRSTDYNVKLGKLTIIFHELNFVSMKKKIMNLFSIVCMSFYILNEIKCPKTSLKINGQYFFFFFDSVSNPSLSIRLFEFWLSLYGG